MPSRKVSNSNRRKKNPNTLRPMPRNPRYDTLWGEPHYGPVVRRNGTPKAKPKKKSTSSIKPKAKTTKKPRSK